MKKKFGFFDETLKLLVIASRSRVFLKDISEPVSVCSVIEQLLACLIETIYS